MKIVLLLVLILCSTNINAQRVKVSCVGNSITYGAGTGDREINSYPSQLQRMLGDGYQVGNFGKSGATLLSKGHRPYILQEEYKKALEFAGDLVVIHLGVNDTDPRNWPNYRDEFIQDYISLIASFKKANPKAMVWICKMTPISSRHSRFKSGTRDWFWLIQEEIEEIGRQAGVRVIDLTSPLYPHPNLLPDGLHPNSEGAEIIAKTVYSALTGNYGGLSMEEIYSDNMVLQRNIPLVVSGIANAGEKIVVKFAGQKEKVEAGVDGKWSVTLDSMEAGGPYDLSISAPSRSFKYSNVLVGEIWMCSGQSNMRFTLRQSDASERKIAMNYASKPNNIRIYNQGYHDPMVWDTTLMERVNKLEYYSETTWEELSDSTALDFSAIAMYFGMMLADSLDIPIGLINNSVGGSTTESWIDRKTLEFDFPDILDDWRTNDFVQKWVRERATLNLKNSKDPLQRHPYEPCFLYEAGVLPLVDFQIRGVIWYQGESNAHNIEAHETLFPLVVKSFRNAFGENIPFYYVQLSSIERPTWAWFRDSQRMMMCQVPNSGMAVSSDRADTLNKNEVHPKRKMDVGRRLGRIALKNTYSYDLVPYGPMYKSVEFEKGAAYIEFEYGEGMTTSDGKPIRAFEIAEVPGQFKSANAIVLNGKLKVWNDEIMDPKFVRYAWEPFTNANLVNSDGLPASTFKTK